ncbi:MAG: hypothetical protein IJM30_06505 [Thermoguttaceae bacterium]|nr:hypothetical protein [Thermoguttaceae bacterium]
MSELNWNIDELVGKIMADLRASSLGSSASETSAALTRDFEAVRASAKKSEPEIEKNDENESVFVVSERVLFADRIRQLALVAKSKQWSLERNAIVTPAARDELKKLGIEISSRDILPGDSKITVSASSVPRETPKESASAAVSRGAKKDGSRPRVWFFVHLPDAEREPSAVREYLERNAETTFMRTSCLKETSQKIAEALANDKSLKAIVATRDSAIASIWFNRRQGVRAIVVRSLEQARRDVGATDANVAIVDPRDVGSHQFRLIVDYFVRRGRDGK